MIVVDSSALVAILEAEPEAGKFLDIIQDEPRRLMEGMPWLQKYLLASAP